MTPRRVRVDDAKGSSSARAGARRTGDAARPPSPHAGRAARAGSCRTATRTRCPTARPQRREEQETCGDPGRNSSGAGRTETTPHGQRFAATSNMPPAPRIQEQILHAGISHAQLVFAHRLRVMRRRTRLRSRLDLD
ncbi:hypothetical protein GN956_G20031 [Arapaima gigas]